MGLNLDVVIYEGSINEVSKKGYENYDRNSLTQDQKVARTAGHEIEHATNPIDTKHIRYDIDLPKSEHQRAKDIGVQIGNEFGKLNPK